MEDLNRTKLVLAKRKKRGMAGRTTVQEYLYRLKMVFKHFATIPLYFGTNSYTFVSK